LCGLTTLQVSARGFLLSEGRHHGASRLVRAKQKIRLAGIPYEGAGPRRAWEAAALRGVLAVIYLVFTGRYAATSGEGI